MQVLGWDVAIDGRGVRVLTPPSGVGHVELRERVRPLRPFRELLARRAAGLGADAVIGAARRVTTVEGEDAAIATVTARGDERAHTLGVIYSDDFLIAIDGRAPTVAAHAAIAGAVEDLVLHVPVGLGQPRHRRFRYQPPAGWTGVPRGLVTTWYAPGYPRTSAWIKVMPARPYREPIAVAQVDSLLHDDAFASFVPDRRTLRGDADFDGFTAVITRTAGRFTSPARDGERRMLITAALTDGRYVYCLRLDTGADRAAEHEQTFLELVRTCVAVPSPRPTEMGEAFRYLVE